MSRRRIFFAALGVACVAGGLAARSQPHAAEAAPRVPVVQWAGPVSAITGAQFIRIVDQSAWDELWARHRADKLERNLRDWPVVPAIDFDRYMIVACFTGKDRVNDGEFVQEIHRRDDTLVIRYASLSFQTAISDPNVKLPDLTCMPYGIWLIERHEGPIVIEQDKHRLLTEPPNWVEVHRFDRLGG
jgi:hypothetical protein